MKKPFKMIALSTTAAAMLFGFAGPQITSAASLDQAAAQGNNPMAALLQSNLDAGLSTWYTQYAHNFAWYVHLTAGLNNPNHQITREQFTSRLVGEMEARGNLPMVKPVVVEIKDLESISPEYAAAIQRALSYGIVKLDADGKFNPKTVIARADADSEIRNAQQYLKAHSSPVEEGKTISAEQAVQLIKQVVGPEASLQIKIDPAAVVTRESFVYLLVHTLQTSGRLPMINVVPVDVKDASEMDISKSGAVQTALALGFIALDQAGNFNPTDELTLVDGTDIAAKATAFLKGHPAPPVDNATIAAE
ncbi:S-layer homology domain-containing protein [Paenibacillus sacheonensis]|uniref:SLH domain-containing protein n=1 Tax=Paenibacillus sacheonensis TaxID=742054 RepID=A0A7X5C0Q8_9BACL|nr:S-layer homology domain-containing protein [Paenibacillus sacheonensis]MBM7568162.1 hypothetical protein [Paenibacillus sacheonensis]NBC71836.1 hypothetical protein [Paenibacillus sacheonensis]